MRAGIAASTPTAASVTTTAAAIHQAGGIVVSPAWFASLNSPMPSGTPSRAPGTAAMICAADSPAVTCRGVVPKARDSAAGRLVSSTVSALAAMPYNMGARGPRRRSTLIRLSRRLPVPLLLGLRLVARRPRRAALSAASVAVTVAGIVAVLAFHATGDQRRFGGTSGLANPVVLRDGQLLLVLTAALLALAAINAVFTAWATVLDTRRPSALVRALGTSPRQVSAGLSAAQALPALPGAIIGIPAGIALFAVANSGGVTTIPPLSWLLAAVLVALVAVAGLTTIPARLANRHPPGEILRSETR